MAYSTALEIIRVQKLDMDATLMETNNNPCLSFHATQFQLILILQILHRALHVLHTASSHQPAHVKTKV